MLTAVATIVPCLIATIPLVLSIVWRPRTVRFSRPGTVRCEEDYANVNVPTVITPR